MITLRTFLLGMEAEIICLLRGVADGDQVVSGVERHKKRDVGIHSLNGTLNQVVLSCHHPDNRSQVVVRKAKIFQVVENPGVTHGLHGGVGDG